MPTVKETFDLMPTKFKPANAAGVIQSMNTTVLRPLRMTRSSRW